MRRHVTKKAQLQLPVKPIVRAPRRAPAVRPKKAGVTRPTGMNHPFGFPNDPDDDV
jgi:hypothetical protein